MTQIDETIKMVVEATKLLKEKYGKCEFKKDVNKKWHALYDRHLRELTYVFTVEEVKTAYANAIDDFAIFCQANEKTRKK